MATAPNGRKPRRVVKPAKPGVDPTPAHSGAELAAEDDPRNWGDRDGGGEPGSGASSARDEEIKRDKPPHWG